MTSVAWVRIVLLSLLTCILVSGCDPQQQQPPLPLTELSFGEYPLFTDDKKREGLLIAARQHLSFLHSLPDTYEIQLGETSVNRSGLIHSLKLFTEIVRRTQEPFELNSRIREHFLVYQAGGREQAKNREMLVTGYYEPLFKGSMVAGPSYKHPLYEKPDDLTIHPETGETGRYDTEGNFTSYWTRAEIENNHLLKKYEAVYMQDPFDAFLLHIQGSGRIQLPDGSVRAIRFAAHNGHKYQSIGKLLVDENKLTLKEASVPTIRAYLEAHPEETIRILQHNPRFIFFKWGANTTPKGSSDVHLTPERSIAIDQAVLPAGLVGYLASEKPAIDIDGSILQWRPFGRFVLPQDSGAAIKGAGRVDLFLGSGKYAEITAGNMKQQGKLYFLLAKDLVDQQ